MNFHKPFHAFRAPVLDVKVIFVVTSEGFYPQIGEMEMNDLSQELFCTFFVMLRPNVFVFGCVALIIKATDKV